MNLVNISLGWIGVAMILDRLRYTPFGRIYGERRRRRDEGERRTWAIGAKLGEPCAARGVPDGRV